MGTGMVFTATSKSADAPDVAADIYDATFEGVTTKFIEGGQYGDGDRFVWGFALLDEDGEALYDNGDPLVLDALTSTSLNTASKTTPKAVRFLKAIASPADFEAFEDGKGIDMDSQVGNRCQVEVAIRDNGWPTIVNVLPPRRSRRARANQSE